ncbi:class I SAM-dependent methyltransferase [Kineosporia mesophila]|uniref:Class I SAM-dependent methyltransferase n=1 Tax=Kineosporia mesophila TaxID=566012 RepID=A0ABP6Z9Y1_9ACTN|nr:class I SAM-dependent methyltransferase [Kineosporia mesophila]
MTADAYESDLPRPGGLPQRARRAAATVLGRRRPMVDAGIEEYAQTHSSPQSPALAAVAADTRRLSDRPFMMSDAPQAHLLATLVHLGRARNVLEIGTFTGYSALAMASALPEGGRITTCEIDTGNAAIAAGHFAASPHADRIDLRVGPALPTVRNLPGPFDLVFIDADKTGYVRYFEAVLPKLSPHGVIAVDNTLHSGLVPQDPEERVMVRALHEFNTLLRHDRRVEQVMLTVRDGITLIRLTS